MTTRLRGLPPGRAGRMWLSRRLTVATRGGDLLEQKLRILMAEEQDFSLLVERTQVAWTDAARALDGWLLRSALLSGERALRLACDGESAGVDIEWRLTMGARYPAAADCTIPDRPATAFTPDNTALRHAISAAEQALRAGVDHAVATAALASVQQEISATRRQLRAIRDRWIPRLESAHDELMIALDEQEHDEQVRLRWAAGPSGSRRQP